MKSFDHYLETTKEIGTLKQIHHSIGFVDGIPHAAYGEVVIFEDNSLGQTITLTKDHAEVLFLSNSDLKSGTKVVRSGELLEIDASTDMLGLTLDSLGQPVSATKKLAKNIEKRGVDISPPGLETRLPTTSSFHTGTSLVDLVLPLGKGQRELVIGDKKTGKSNFLVQALASQASEGSVCIYALIGKTQNEIKSLQEELKKRKVMGSTVIVATRAYDTAGSVFITPFTAMTIAEYFRDQKYDVLLVLDDLSIHANTYREISLLAKRFPGRSSYPGDIFYTHARLMERAGNFKTGSITCLPVVESVERDLSGFIQTNTMSMTDGHLFFDSNLFNQGIRPAINPFLSVTRVGRQTSTSLVKEIGQELSKFLIKYRQMQQFVQFGAEVSKDIQLTIAQGQRLEEFFKQGADSYRSLNLSAFIVLILWSGLWRQLTPAETKIKINELEASYTKNSQFKVSIDNLMNQNISFDNLIEQIKKNPNIIEAK